MKTWIKVAAAISLIPIAIFAFEASAKYQVKHERDKIDAYITRNQLVGKDKAQVFGSLASGLPEFSYLKNREIVMDKRDGKEQAFISTGFIAQTWELKNGPAS